MRIGFDVDGVLADFYVGYEKLIVKMTGENRFPPLDPIMGPAVWDWPQYHGYTEEQVADAWKVIGSRTGFWSSAPPLPGMADLQAQIHDLYMDHDIYFITARGGPAAKTETELWLQVGGVSVPTVLISSAKGPIAKALKLDYYIDDKFENVEDVIHQSPATKAFLLHKNYNLFRPSEIAGANGQTLLTPYIDPAGLIRVSTVGEFIARIQAASK